MSDVEEDEFLVAILSNDVKKIEDKEYYKELDKVEKINKYSIVFYGKECIVRG